MNLTKDQKLLLLTIAPGEVRVPAEEVGPEWLANELIQLGLARRIGVTTAWALTLAGEAARRDLIDGDHTDRPTKQLRR